MLTDEGMGRVLRAEERVAYLEQHLSEINQAVPDLEARLTRWRMSGGQALAESSEEEQ